MPFPHKMSYSLQKRALPVKLIYQNGDSPPEDLKRFRGLNCIRRGAMTSNGKLLKLKDSITRYDPQHCQKLASRDC